MELACKGGDVELGGSSDPLTSTSTANRAKTLEWSDLNFSVNGNKILDGCHGKAPASSLTCIMGPSGAGKSSLLNVLAGRVASGGVKQITGNISIDANPIDPYKYRKMVAYVMQDDAIMPTSTPREALTFSASLRLGQGASKKVVKDTVDNMITELGLDECADRLVGGELIKGISGGERKRTSVGVELVTDPSLVFLDEPTSGLDSYSAHNLVMLLRKLSSSGRCTVLCTIHQPSSEVFLLFDNTIVLKSGRVVYSGPVKEMSPFFSKGGFPIPELTNPADHAMFTVQINADSVLEKAGMFQQLLDDTKKRSSSISSDDGDKGGKDITPEVTSTAWVQLCWLMSREMDALVRDKAALIGRFGITIFLNVLFGLIFKNAGSKDDTDRGFFFDHFGALTMVTISSMFGAAQPTLLTFPSQRPIFLREYSTGTYSIIPYFISKVCFEVPLAFAQTLVQWLVVYWLIGFKGSFILLLLASWALALASASVAVLMGCMVTDIKTATELMPVIFVPQMLFAGFFVSIDQIPSYLRWAQYACSLKYAMNLLTIIEFGEGSCQRSPDAGEQCTALLVGNDIVEDHWWFYIIVLSTLFLVFRVIGAIILAKKATTVF